MLLSFILKTVGLLQTQGRGVTVHLLVSYRNTQTFFTSVLKVVKPTVSQDICF